MLSAKSSVAVRPAAAQRRSTILQATGGGTRTMWLPDIKPPAHLNGTMPGDAGFDPLGLGAYGEGRLKWYQEAEKTNGRYAMMAVAGILGQELLGVPVKWFDAGRAEYSLPVIAQLPIFFLVMGFFETKRYIGFKETGSSGAVNSFPFDPVGLNSQKHAINEVKNGRLAMVAFVGFAVQALVSRTQPIEGLQKHLADPFGRNITYYLSHQADVFNGTA